MRPLLVGPAERETAKAIADYAARRENWYRPGETSPPGDKPEHTAVFFMGFRCVFSYTVIDGGLHRYLSVSVEPRADGTRTLPNPFALMTLADLFGFSGWQHNSKVPEDWRIAENRQENTLFVHQKIAEVPAPSKAQTT